MSKSFFVKLMGLFDAEGRRGGHLKTPLKSVENDNPLLQTCQQFFVRN